MFESLKSGILGGIVGLFLFGIGLIAATRIKGIGLFYVYLAALGAYFALVAEAQIDGPYRQLGIIPAISVFVAVGALTIMVSIVALISLLKRTRIPLNWTRLIIFAGCVLIFLVTPVRKFDYIVGWGGPEEAIHQDRWEVAQRIKELTQEGSKLVVAGEYTTHVGGNDLSPVLYYYAGRQGWTIQPWEWRNEVIDELIQKGATHFVAIRKFNFPDSGPILGDEDGSDFLNGLIEEYRVLYEDENSLILDLRTPTTP
jgi:hypothetical protein